MILFNMSSLNIILIIIILINNVVGFFLSSRVIIRKGPIVNSICFDMF
jgi:hypothetical protein